MLEFLEKSASIFDMGVETIQIGRRAHTPHLALTRESLSRIRELERVIPPPQYVQLTGKLDSIRHSDRTFTLKPDTGPPIKGVAAKAQMDELQANWGNAVLISGMCHFTPAGNVLRLETDSIRPATDRDLQLWALVPEPIFGARESRTYLQPQGPRSGLNAIFGQWPGDETDEEIEAVLETLS